MRLLILSLTRQHHRGCNDLRNSAVGPILRPADQVNEVLALFIDIFLGDVALSDDAVGAHTVMIHAPSRHLGHLIEERIRRTVIGHKVPVDVAEEAVVTHIVGEQADQHIPSSGVIEHCSAARLIPVAIVGRGVKIVDAIVIGKGLHSSAAFLGLDHVSQGLLTHDLEAVALDHVHLGPGAGADGRGMVTHLNVLPIQGVCAANVFLVP